MSDEAEDAELVSRAANGDGDAFARLYGRYKRDVWETSYFLCQRNHHDAEEAMQETFLKAWRSLRRYGAVGAFKPWLLTICRNACIDRVHRVPAKPVPLDTRGEDEIVDRACSPEAVLDSLLLRATLAELPRKECEAWFFIDVLGFNSDDTAHIVGARAASTVRSRVRSARRQLAEALSDDPSPVISRASEREIQGLYHAPPVKAIVVVLMGSARAGGSRPARFARARRASIAVADGCQNGRPQGSDVPAVALGPRGALPDIRCDDELIGFFDELDDDVPSGTRFLAIVEHPTATATARWCETHPHWELLRPPARGSWREEAERLLAGCVACPAQQSASRALALLDASQRFIWTYNRRGATL